MKYFLLISLSLFTITAWSADVTSTNADAKATYEDIKQTLGSVPTFLKDFPQEGISGAWMDMKGIQLNTATAIPGKYKELIGLAVAAQVPCRYCTYFHTEAAKLNKASKEEIAESIALAAYSRRWSAFIHGMQIKEADFRKDVDKMLKFASKNQGLQAMEVTPAPLNTADDVYKDVKATYGFVPEFIKLYPQSGVVGAWKEMKAIEMNPMSHLPTKYKHLLGLAVSSQIPCSFCVYYHNKAAVMNGATKEEISEAVAMAGITREWSTILNGQYTDEKKFQAETDKVMNHLKSKMPKDVGMNH